MLAPELKSQIDALRNAFWSSGMANPLSAIEQISYLIFMKRLDDLDRQNLMKAQRVSSFQYVSHFAGSYTTPSGQTVDGEHLRRSHWSQYPSAEMYPWVKDVVFPWIKTLDAGDSFAQSLRDASFLIPSASLLTNAVGIIEDLRITEQNDDTTGDIYEYLLSALQSSGKNGQFRTPRHIIQAIVQMVNPTKHDKVGDLAAGTAGFLINAYKHILQTNTSPDAVFVDDDNNKHYPADLLSGDERVKIQQSLIGHDFDSTMVRIALMNTIMHGIANPQISYADTLGKGFTHEEEFDVLLMNPPFKGSIDRAGMSADFEISTTKTELLFAELIVQKLVVGGRAGVIVPDGVLFGASRAHKAVRKILVEECDLRAVISLPSGVFKPYAGVSTAILIFTKGDETNKVWFYDLASDGFSLDDKRNEITDNDIPDLIEQFKTVVDPRKYDAKPSKDDKRFRVDKSEIVENDYDLSISKYKKIEHIPVEYDTPEVILNRLAQSEQKIKDGLEKVKRMIG